MSDIAGFPKRLIEVDLPIKRISAHSRREKSIRYGHIATLHVWWARRPLAACRAVILAALFPDPADPLCPSQFKHKAAECMMAFRDRRGGKQRDWNNGHELRHALLDFIADFSNWDNASNKLYLETSRALMQAAHESLGGVPGTLPLVVDPFAGGGAIALEALRVGADVFASDLNPVASLLNKVVVEHVPKYGQQLADEVRKWGAWIRTQADQELADYYPKDCRGIVPIAYLWARTIRCEGPSCGRSVPLMRSLWLAKKGNRSIGLKLIPDQRLMRIEFELIRDARVDQVGEGTVRGGSATCPACGYTTPVKSVRRQIKERNGGAADAQLVAVRFGDQRTGERGWRLADDHDREGFHRAVAELERRSKAHNEQRSLVPDEPLPQDGTLGFRVQKYGMLKWGDLYSPRQALALTTLGRLVREAPIDCNPELASAVRTVLALAVDRMADFNSTLCVLNSTGGRGVKSTFSRQALPMVWDFMETNPFNTEAANWQTCIDVVDEVIQTEKMHNHHGVVQRVSATNHPLPDSAANAVVTDPPYYDAVPYADLSDFFYVWLRRNLVSDQTALTATALTPKEEECIVNPVAGKDKAFYERTMAKAMMEAHRILDRAGVGVIVFAHKSTSGWEAQLQAMINAGWVITGSWPIDTERPGRLRAQNSAALASSVHLVCRPREAAGNNPGADSVGEWRDVLAALPRRLHLWMPRLAQEGVVGADAIFACLGPALEIYSRYSRVERSSGELVTLKEYLEQVWTAVAREALSVIFKEADASGLEEDARLTAMWLWTLSTATANSDSIDDIGELGDEEDALGEESSDGGEGDAAQYGTLNGGYYLEFDAARKIAQGLGAHLENLNRVVKVKGETARLLSVSERTRYLFGKDEAQARTRKRKKASMQLSLFTEFEQVEEEAGWGGKTSPSPGVTVLDRVHQAMILFAVGRAEAMKRFLVEEGAGNDTRFWQLAQSLSALYPPNSDEKRWVDGVLARKKGLGF